MHALINVGASELELDWNAGWANVEGALRLALEHGLHEQALRAHSILGRLSVEAREYAAAAKAISNQRAGFILEVCSTPGPNGSSVLCRRARCSTRTVPERQSVNTSVGLHNCLQGTMEFRV